MARLTAEEDTQGEEAKADDEERVEKRTVVRVTDVTERND